MAAETITRDGEIMDEDTQTHQGTQLDRFAKGSGEVVPIQSYETPTSLAVSLSRAEIDQQIATARAFPRQITVVARNILSLATLDEETAKECVYALPRAGKAIKGPSIRLAEIIASQWGNCRVGARVVHVDRHEKFVEAEGVFHDLETNTATTSRVRRRLSDKSGRLLNADMIVVTGNAAASIAKRNAILGGIPKAVWRRAYDEVEHVIAGDVKTLVERRGKALQAFAAFGVTPDRIFTALDVAGLDDIGVEQLVTLLAMHSAIKSGEAEVEEMFPTEKSAAAATVAPTKSLDDFAAGAAKSAQPQEAAKPKESAADATKVEEKPAEAAKSSTSGGGGGGSQGPSTIMTIGGGSEGRTIVADMGSGGGDGPKTAAATPAAENGGAAAPGGSQAPGATAPAQAGGGGGDGLNPATPAASPKPAAAAPPAKLDPTSLGKLDAYHLALSNRMTASSLGRAGNAVFGENWPDDESTMGKAVRRIYDLHSDRCAGKIAPADVDNEVRKMVAAL